MPLKFPAAWRFARGGLQPLPPAAVNDFQRLVLKVTAQVKKRWDVLENLKGIFAAAIGSMHGCSSSESWGRDGFAELHAGRCCESAAVS